MTNTYIVMINREIKGCPFCMKALALLDSKSLGYRQIEFGSDDKSKIKDFVKLISKQDLDRVTSPQIFLMHDDNGENSVDQILQKQQVEYIGGFTQLNERFNSE